MDWTPIIVLVVAVVIISVAWRVITGLIRLVLTLGVVALAVYVLWTFLR